jgi:hypothetical protein
MPKLDPEERIYRAQYRWIKKNYGQRPANDANYGWGVSSSDDGSPDVATKVYGHGVLRTWIESGRIKHDFNPY